MRLDAMHRIKTKSDRNKFYGILPLISNRINRTHLKFSGYINRTMSAVLSLNSQEYWETILSVPFLANSGLAGYPIRVLNTGGINHRILHGKSSSVEAKSLSRPFLPIILPYIRQPEPKLLKPWHKPHKCLYSNTPSLLKKANVYTPSLLQKEPCTNPCRALSIIVL